MLAQAATADAPADAPAQKRLVILDAAVMLLGLQADLVQLQ
jgi:hypothetical protein